MIEYSGEENRRDTLRRPKARPFLVLGWIAAGITSILLVIFVFYPHFKTPLALLLKSKSGPKVFRTKIPEDIKISQNLFRGKISAFDPPVELPTKIESMPPVEKKEAPSQPIVSPPEQSKPRRETAYVQPVESQTMIETTPPLAKAASSQSTDAPPEQNELRQENEPHPPGESQTKFETTLPAEEPSISFQPIFVPSEQIELPENVDLHQADVSPQPVKDDVIEKTQERIIRREKWLLSQKPSYYTIQLMGVRKEALLFDFVKRNQLLEQNEIAFYQTTFKDKAWFQLLYGVYSTKKDAQAAADNLPLKIRKSSPWIRRLSAVQKAIRARTSP